MPEAVTLNTSAKYWRVEIEAWTADLRVYRSIGTRVAVYHEAPITTIWGSRQTDWEQEPAARVCIRNVYSGAGPCVATREHQWQDTSPAKLKEWSAGSAISLTADRPGPENVSIVRDIHKVESTVSVTIGNETLTAVVSAGKVPSEQTESAAAQTSSYVDLKPRCRSAECRFRSLFYSFQDTRSLRSPKVLRVRPVNVNLRGVGAFGGPGPCRANAIQSVIEA